jgi:hypothetical protein
VRFERLDRRVHHDAGVVQVGRDLQRVFHVGRDIAMGQPARHEAGAGRQGRNDAVEAKGAPVLARRVPGQQVPALARLHHPVRLHRARRGGGVVVAVVEAQFEPVGAGFGEQRDGLQPDLRLAAHQRYHRRAHAVEPAARMSA